MRGQFSTAARIGRRQHGRVARRQLLDAGIDGKRIDRWVADGRLCVVHRGVYAIGHTAPSLLAAYMAAVLAGGPGAVLSHRAAAYVLKLLRGLPPRPEITITTADRRRPGIIIHRARARALRPRDICVVDGIRMTTVPRVLLDLAPSLKPADLARACHEAWVHHRVTPEHIEACIARNPNKPGVAKLRHAFGADVTLSDLEDAFVALLKDHDLPAARTNIDVGGDKVDCHWPRLGLTIELHSYRFHGSRYAYEKDITRRRRSRHIAFSYGDIVDRGEQTIVELREILADARSKVGATSGR
jgi:hypothetical protein